MSNRANRLFHLGLRSALFIAAACLLAFELYEPKTKVHATTYDVLCPGSPQTNGDSLRSAFDAASSGSNRDTINLTPGCVYELDDTPLYAGDGINGLDPISNDAVGTDLTINGNGATIRRAATASQNFRILHVLSGAEVIINNLTISGGNIAGNGGGISNFGSLTINNSTIANNSASTDGGGIYSTGDLTINNSTVSGNAANGNGGGISVGGGSAQLSFVTLSNNTADNDNNSSGSGGGIARSVGTVVFRNGIITGNKRGSGAATDCSGATAPDWVTSGTNLFGSAASDQGCTGTGGLSLTNGGTPSDVVNALGSNGGPTQTHSLPGTSPALNQISPANCTFISGVTASTDQRGFLRPGGANCDVGAFELGAQAFSVTSTTPSKNALNVARTSNVIANFNIATNQSTINSNSFKVRGSNTANYGGTISFPTSSSTQLDPTNNFKAGELITASLSSSIQSSGGMTLTPFLWQFFASTAVSSGEMRAHPTTPSFGVGSAQDTALGDLDGDGDLDAVVAITGVGAETVWLNNGAGSFTAHPTTPSFGVGDSQDIVLGDIDGDGDLDALVANASGQAETVWLNNGSGSFTAHPTTPSFGTGSSNVIALGDIDGDGDLDAVVGNILGEAETVWLNDGLGNFIPHPTTPSFGAGDSFDIALGDLDGDGDLDAVVANGSAQAETVWLNNGLGTFSAHPVTPSFGVGQSHGIELGDLDGDGDLDAVVANQTGQAETVWLNNGSGSFTAHPATPSFGVSDSFDIALGDLDGDGDLDAAVANNTNQAETIWLNNGLGSFTSHPTFPSYGAEASRGIVLGDIDGDGDLDTVVANATIQTVWLNDKATTTTAVTSSLNPSVFGQQVTFTATVTPSPAIGTPAGTVAFLDGGNAISGCESVTLSSGQAQCLTSALGTGNHTITAQYDGNANFLSSTGSLTGNPQVVNPPPTLSINDVSQDEGNAGTTNFSFTVSLSSPAGPGGVTFTVNTANGTTNPANAGSDYVAITNGSGGIAEGSSATTVTVQVNGDTTVEQNETFFVNVTNVTGATLSDGQGLGTIQNDDVALTPIHDIQGPGASSPIVGSSVTTRGVVTGVKSNGFFIQEPDASVDADPATSEGILVFTSSTPPPAATVGSYVQVTGTVSEFVPGADPLQPPLTQLTSTTVVQLSTGNSLPAAIPLTATFPDPAGPFDQLERLEGMRVSVASLTVTGPTVGSVNEANATSTSTGVFYAVVTGVARPFREAGIQAPDPAPSGGGTIPPIPRFDSNPERLRVDSDALTGGPLLDVNSGAVVTGLVGPLDYTFRTYTILPDPGASIGVAGGATPTTVTAPTSQEFTIASYNLQRFFDTVNDPDIGEPVLTAAAYDKRLNKASLAIRNNLQMPDIIGVQEMENLSTLQALAARISADAVAASQPDPKYTAYLVEGNDIGGIDVGFLVKTAEVSSGTPRVEVVEVQQELDGTLLVNPDSSTSVLNDRPPLRLNAIVHHANGESFPVTVIVNHLRALNSANSEAAGSNGWPTEGARVRAKRLEQAEDLANLVQARQTADPTEHIILVGDFNAFEVNDGLADLMNVIAGTPVPDNETAVAGDGVDLVNPDLDNLFDTRPPAERYGYVFDGNAQNLDHLLVNAPLVSDTVGRRIEHARIGADFADTSRNDGTTPVRLSDHDPLVGFFQVSAFATADLSITKVEGADPVTAGFNLSYTITVTNGGPDAATNVSWSDTLPTGTTFVSVSKPNNDWSCTEPSVGAGGTVTCSNPSLAAGSAVFTLTIAVESSVAGSTVLSNTAEVTSTTADSDTDDRSATETTTVRAPTIINGTKTVSGTFNLGDTIVYTIVLTNSGSAQGDNSGDEFTDTLPSGLTLVSATAPSGTASTSGNTASWNGSIPGNDSVTITITATINSGTQGTTVTNQGNISYDADGSGTNEASAVTDDPTVDGANNPTSFMVNCPGTLVTNTSDSGAGSLRDVIAGACPGSTITFDIPTSDPGYDAGVYTINLLSEIVINKNLTIQGLGANVLTISGNQATRIFSTPAGVTVTLDGLTIRDGGAVPTAGAIDNSGIMTISNCILTQNAAAGGGPTAQGGAINNVGTLTIIKSTLSNNSAENLAGKGGAISNSGTLTIIDSTLSGNSAHATGTSGGSVSHGGAIFNSGSNAVVNLINSTLSGNSAVGGVSTPFGGSQAFGGAIYNAGGGQGVVRLTNCTLNGNFVIGGDLNAGGGIYNGGGLVSGRNTIIAQVIGTDVFGPFESQGHNIIGNTSGAIITNSVPYPGGDKFDAAASPLNLGPLQNNGGATETHALGAGSVAIDAGADAATLDGVIDDSVTSITLDDATAIPAGGGFIIQIDDEQMRVDEKAGNVLSVTRGVNGTTAATHDDGAGVNPAFDQRGAGFARKLDSSDADATAAVDIGAFEVQASVEDITDQTTAEDTTLSFDFAVGGLVQSVTASSSNQALVPDANLSVTGTGSTRTLQLTPAPNAHTPKDGTTTITVTLTTTNSQTAEDTFSVTVTPVADTPDVADIATDEDTMSGPVSVTRNPVDGAEVTHFRVSAITGGTLFMPDGATPVTGGTFISFTDAAPGLRFKPLSNYTGPGHFTVQAATGNLPAALGGGTDTSTITVNPVNDRPTLGPLNNRLILEDASQQTVTLTGINAGGNESQTLSVTATSSNTAIVPDPVVNYTSPNASGTLSYTPVANANGTAVITVTVSDGGGGNETVQRTFAINITPVNDAPSFTKGADQTVSADAGPQTVSNWATGISAGAPNESGQVLGFMVANNNPALFSSQPAVSPAGTLTFTPKANASGVATVSLTLKDDGGTANGGQNSSAAQSFQLTVSPGAANDAPINTVPGAQAVVKNGTLVFSAANSNQVAVADADAGGAIVRVALTAQKGAVTLSSTAGLVFSTGDGTADQYLIFKGTLSDINAALNGMQFKPTLNYTGAASLKIISNDLGNTGTGGALTDTDTIPISVTNSIAGESSFALSAPVYSLTENELRATVTVTRDGDKSVPASVQYRSSDTVAALINCGAVTGHASNRCDYATSVGTLRFAAGETTREISVPVVNDSYSEGPESVTISLSKPSGAKLGSTTSAVITIADDDTGTGGGAAAPAMNPLSSDEFFIRQLYLDVLGREADADGLAYWLDALKKCGGSEECGRASVATSFFRSEEFRETGSFAYRLYRVGLGRTPRYEELAPDMASLSSARDAAELQLNKADLVAEFMARAEFSDRYDSRTEAGDYVVALLESVGLPNHPSRKAWVRGLAGGSLSRGEVLWQLVESAEVSAKFIGEAEVEMLYFGLLRRDRGAAHSERLEQSNRTQDLRQVINGFISSDEFYLRAGPR